MVRVTQQITEQATVSIPKIPLKPFETISESALLQVGKILILAAQTIQAVGSAQVYLKRFTISEAISETAAIKIIHIKISEAISESASVKKPKVTLSASESIGTTLNLTAAPATVKAITVVLTISTDLTAKTSKLIAVAVEETISESASTLSTPIASISSAILIFTVMGA